MLADDDDGFRALHAPRLRAAGYEVCEAADGQRTLALIRERRPALVLLDVWMPGLSGLQVLQRLRDEPAPIDLRVVMLSHCAEADARLEALALGAVDYWVKDRAGVDDLAGLVASALAADAFAADPD